MYIVRGSFFNAVAAVAACAGIYASVGPAVPPTIVAFGDSLTAGRGAPAGASYPDFLQGDLTAAGYHYKVVNLGESGDTTTDGLTRLPDVLAAKPRLVILEFGGNDGLRGLPVTVTRANLQTMIERIRAAHIPILLVGMSLPPNYGPEYIHSFQLIFQDLARQDHLPLLPFLYQDLVPKLRQDPGLLQDDGIHATAAGNRVVAATVWKYTRPLLEK